MASVTVVRNPEVLRGVQEATEAAKFYQENLGEFQRCAYRYVVLSGASLVGFGASPEEAHGAAQRGGYDLSKCVTMFVPREGEELFF
jgi:hypothetical protein